MEALSWFKRSAFAITIIPPLLVLVDVVFGKIGEVDNGAMHFYDGWLALMAKLATLAGLGELSAKAAIVGWSFVAVGVICERVFLHE